MENKHTRSVSLIDGHIEGMTDAEIVKALECCKQGTAVDCKECPLYEDKGHTCITILSYKSLDLIKRQQAEIERYKAEHKDFVRKLGDLHSMTIMVMDRRNEIKSEAIKEFAERFKEKATKTTIHYVADTSIKEQETGWYGIFDTEFDNLVKEMTEVSE